MTLSYITAKSRLRSDAAESYKRMRAAGMPAGINSAYRTRAEQEYWYKLWLAGKGNYAAKPGTSNHELGLAIDVPNGPEAWLEKHGTVNGWKQDPKEDWHFNYDPAHDEVAKAIAAKANGSKPTGRALLREIQSALGVPRTGHMDAATVNAWYHASRAQVRNVQTWLGLVRSGIKNRRLHAAWANLASHTK